jgi:hypothetical protein
MKTVSKTGVMMIAIGLGVAGCGGGGGSGEGGAAPGEGTPGAGGAVVTTGLFAQPLFLFENEPDYSDELHQERVLKSAYSKTGELVRVKDEVLSGPGGTAADNYTATQTRFYKTETSGAGPEDKIAFMVDSTASSFTFAPYSAAEDKTGGLITYTFEPKPLSGLLLADALSPTFMMPPSGFNKVKRLRDSGRTFPSGSEGLVVKSAAYHEDTVEFSEDDATLATSFEQMGKDLPAGTKYSHYTFKDVVVRCIEDSDLPVPYQSCFGLYNGRIYIMTVTPKGEYPVPAGLQTYFNETAAAALAAGIRADYK